MFLAIATSTFDRPVISKMEDEDDHGRVIVDTGFTKLAAAQWGGIRKDEMK